MKIVLLGYLIYCFVPVGHVWAQHRKTMSLEPNEILADACTLIDFSSERPSLDKLMIRLGDRVSIMGDSITAAGGYIRLAEAVLKTNYPDFKLPPFVNAGVAGNCAEDMQPRFAKDMGLPGHPAWAFINVGVNDVGRRLNLPYDMGVLKAYRYNVSKMVEQAQAAGAKVVLLTPTLLNEAVESEGNKRLASYVNVMKTIGEEKACAVVDLHDMFLTALRHKTPGVPLTSDGVHMAVYGDAIMAVGVLRAFGVPDSVIAQTDTLPLLQCRAWNMSAKRFIDLLEIPPTRLAKADIIRGFSF